MDLTQYPGGIMLLIYKGGMPPAVLQRAGSISQEAQILAHFLHWEICLFLDRKEADGSCRIMLRNHKREKTDFPETKCIRGPLGSVGLAGLTHRNTEV